LLRAPFRISDCAPCASGDTGLFLIAAKGQTVTAASAVMRSFLLISREASPTRLPRFATLTSAVDLPLSGGGMKSVRARRRQLLARICGVLCLQAYCLRHVQSCQILVSTPRLSSSHFVLRLSCRLRQGRQIDVSLYFLTFKLALKV
jgi:hypothetical protein